MVFIIFKKEMGGGNTGKELLLSPEAEGMRKERRKGEEERKKKVVGCRSWEESWELESAEKLLLFQNVTNNLPVKRTPSGHALRAELPGKCSSKGGALLSGSPPSFK